MLNIIIELSKYLLLVLILLYTFESFTVFRYEDDYDKRYILRKQLLLIVFIDFTAFLVLFLKKEEVGDYLSVWSIAAVFSGCPGIIQAVL